jgi:hypothetical protein
VNNTLNADGIADATPDLIEQWFGRERVAADLAQVESFWSGSGRYVVSVATGQHYYRQQRDRSSMIDLAEKHLEAQAALPGLNLPTFFGDFGTISLPKYWAEGFIGPNAPTSTSTRLLRMWNPHCACNRGRLMIQTWMARRRFCCSSPSGNG